MSLRKNMPLSVQVTIKKGGGLFSHNLFLTYIVFQSWIADRPGCGESIVMFIRPNLSELINHVPVFKLHDQPIYLKPSNQCKSMF